MSVFKSGLALALGLGLGAVASATPIYSASGFTAADHTVTFSEVVVAGNTAIQSQFSAQGVTFGKSANAGTWKLSTAPSGRTGLSGTALTSTTGNQGTANAYLSVLFNNDVDMAGAYFMFNVASPSLTLSAYNNGTLIESFGYTYANSAQSAFLGFSGIVFDELRISSISSRSVLLDSLKFSDVNAVPEPSSLALAGLVFGGLALSRKRARC